MAYTDVWDVTQPLDTQAANQGAVDFRATKLDVMQRISSFGAGLLANRPTPEATSGTANWTGVMYWATDTSQVFRWNGTLWDDISLNIPSGIAVALATTGASVNVSLAAPPTANQILTATDAIHATWQTPTFTTPTTLASALAAIVPTTILLTGTGLGNYTTTNTSYVKVDATNLQQIVTIPIGWKLSIIANGTFYEKDQDAFYSVAIADGTSAVAQRVMQKALEVPSGRIESLPWGLSWVITGDGAAHTISLQFATDNVSYAATLQNTQDVPTMLLFLTPSN
jgi:hypothetical protein